MSTRVCASQADRPTLGLHFARDFGRCYTAYSDLHSAGWPAVQAAEPLLPMSRLPRRSASAGRAARSPAALSSLVRAKPNTQIGSKMLHGHGPGISLIC